MFKLIVIFLLLAVVGSLFSGLFFLYRDRGTGVRTAQALPLRIGLSILIFALLLIGFRLGWIPGYNQ